MLKRAFKHTTYGLFGEDGPFRDLLHEERVVLLQIFKFNNQRYKGGDKRDARGEGATGGRSTF